MDQFKVGDVVQLKSGGPVMTVVSINKHGEATTYWFASSDERGVSSANFPAEALKRTKPE